MLPLWQRIGPVQLNHVAYLVRTGMMRAAVAFFTEQLLWTERENAKVEGDWGVARFLLAPGPGTIGPSSIQLTEEKDWPSDPTIFRGAHIGLTVGDAQASAIATKEWAEFGGLTADIKPANEEGTKWFVAIPELFTFKIEFVTRT